MSPFRIDFDALAWEEPAPGVRFKAAARDGRRLRLVEFTREFEDSDWCTKGHVGLVLEGQLEITFGDGRKEIFSAGDGIFIQEGEAEKHQARVLGTLARLVLVERA